MNCHIISVERCDPAPRRSEKEWTRVRASQSVSGSKTADFGRGEPGQEGVCFFSNHPPGVRDECRRMTSVDTTLLRGGRTELIESDLAESCPESSMQRCSWIAERTEIAILFQESDANQRPSAVRKSGRAFERRKV